MAESFNSLYCPVCDNGTQAFAPLTGPQDPHRAVRCTSCGLGIEVDPSPTPAGDYAPGAYDRVRNAGDGGSRWARFHHDSAVAALRLAQTGPVLPRPGTWVDVGCSNGAMLALLGRRGWDVLGVEADPAAAAQVRAVLGLRVVDFSAWAIAARNQAAPPHADVVSFFDVVEHTFDPVGVVRTAANVVRPGGVIVIEVPDLDAAPVDFSAWKHRRVYPNFTEHLWHFSARSLEQLRANHLPNFKLVRQFRPLVGRLQVVWGRHDAPETPRPPNVTPSAMAVQLLGMPEDKRAQILDGMKVDNPDLFAEVRRALTELTTITHTPREKGGVT